MALMTKKTIASGTFNNPCVSHYGNVIANDDQKDCLKVIRHRNVYVGICILMLF